MTNELAKWRIALNREFNTVESGKILRRMYEILAEHGVTDNLVGQHKIANELLACYWLNRPCLRTHAHDNVNYIAAERAAGRWEE